MSTPAPSTTPPTPPTPSPQTQPVEQPKDQPKSAWTTTSIIGTVISTIVAILYSYGAARLSYNKYGSVGWAILVFFFAPIYYPFHGLFLSTPTPTGILGASRRLKR